MDAGNNGFIELNDIESLHRFLAESAQHAQILFKHSNSCGISSRAYREVAKLEGNVGLITVQKAREVSDEIEQRFELPHETPQVMIVRDGKVVWSASHSRVQAHVIEEALEAEVSLR